MKAKKELDQFETMDLLCEKWIGEGGVHGFDCYDEHINCYMHAADEKIEKKITAQAGEHKVKFHYGPLPTAEELRRRGR